MNTMKKLYRSVKDRKIAGICGGIGEMMDVDPTMIRLVMIILTIATGIIPCMIRFPVRTAR
jgi:phage shock protein C